MKPPLNSPAPPGQARRLVPLVLFALAMGWLEAVVVVYIRGLIGIARTGMMPASDEMMRRLGSLPWLLGTEQTRELSTIVMLAAVAWLAADRAITRFGAFLISFGVWDIAYYLALYALLQWPPSFTTMDILFLIPPGAWWYQPVWLPIAVSAAMIALGLRLFMNRTPGLT